MNSQPSDAANAKPSEKTKRKKSKLQLKAPTQERSRNTVQAIMKACSDIIIREGFFGVTTDKIAKEAGVSIGSLYQFYGNKESVVSAVIQDMFQKDLDFVQSKAADLRTATTLENKICALIKIGLDVYQRNMELRSKLQNIQTYLTDENFYSQTMKVYQKLILNELPEMKDRDPEMVAYILVSTFVGLMDRAVLEIKDVHNNKDFTSELHLLFTHYIAQKS